MTLLQIQVPRISLCSAELWSLRMDPKSTAIGLESGKTPMDHSKAVVIIDDW